MKRFEVELRKAEDGQGDVITGYGAVFYKAGDPGTEYRLWYDIVERIMPGAFDRALREDDVRCSLNHDLNFILGRTSAGTLSLSLDNVGLRYSVTPSDSALAQHAVSAVRRKDVTGSSFMFEAKAATWIEEKTDDGKTLWIREITEVAPLYELGPVCFPAYEATTAEIEGRSNGCPDAPARWSEWRQEHLTRARESLANYRTGLTLERVLLNRQRRERRLRVRV